MASLMLVRNVVGELQPKRTLAASRGFLAAARLSCIDLSLKDIVYSVNAYTPKSTLLSISVLSFINHEFMHLMYYMQSSLSL